MTDAELRDKAEAHLRRTTISYQEWKRRCADPAYPAAATEWGQAFALLEKIGGEVPQPAADTYQLTLVPNWNNGADANDVAHNYNSVWVWSNNEKGYAPPNGRDVYRVLLLDPRLKDANGKPGCDEWFFVISRLWPASYDPTKHGAWGREANFHNVASQDGPNGGVGWGFGSGVSALALDWQPQNTTPTIGLEYVQSGGAVVPLPAPSRDVLHEYVVHFVAGRTDGTTPRPGQCLITVDGGEPFGMTNVNTIQKASSGGTDYVQQWMAAAWDGDYTQNLFASSATGFQLTRIGRTLAEARADVPTVTGGTIGSQAWNGKNPNAGPPALAKL